MSKHLPELFPALASIRDSAAGIGFSFSIVRKWTYKQAPRPQGWPESVKIGGKVCYRRVDLERWLDGLVDETAGTVPMEPTSADVGLVARRPGRPKKSPSVQKGGKK